jgi:hypothetical protein
VFFCQPNFKPFKKGFCRQWFVPAIILSKPKFTYDSLNFYGEGWEFIRHRVLESSNVLIGEDHFTNEIPAFTKAIVKIEKFDHFIIEEDPYSTEIIENSILEFTEEKQKQFYEAYKDFFSFYALTPEFNLLEYVVNSGTNVMGTDQIVAYCDCKSSS